MYRHINSCRPTFKYDILPSVAIFPLYCHIYNSMSMFVNKERFQTPAIVPKYMEMELIVNGEEMDGTDT
jgi:hypothetical protein